MNETGSKDTAATGGLAPNSRPAERSLGTTAAARTRIRELASGRDDFDRAVAMLLDDFQVVARKLQDCVQRLETIRETHPDIILDDDIARGRAVLRAAQDAGSDMPNALRNSPRWRLRRFSDGQLQLHGDTAEVLEFPNLRDALEMALYLENDYGISTVPQIVSMPAAMAERALDGRESGMESPGAGPLPNTAAATTAADDGGKPVRQESLPTEIPPATPQDGTQYVE